MVLRSRCGRNKSLSYVWFDDATLSVEDVASRMAEFFAGEALKEGAIRSLRKDSYEDMLYGFFRDCLERLCDGSPLEYAVDSPRLCQRAGVPVFEHRWRFYTTLYKRDCMCDKPVALQFRHYVGEPETDMFLLVGLVFHVKPWPRVSDVEVHAQQDEFINKAIDCYCRWRV